MNLELKLILIAVVFGIIGFVLPIQTDSVFDIEINNTNLAPSVPGETVGTGERVQGVTYYANETPIEIFVWGHGQNVSQTAEIHLFINGTKVADTSGRPLGASEQSNKTIVAMIPRYASYKIEANNAHHYEWREYRVIAGTNGSVRSQTTILTQQEMGQAMHHAIIASMQHSLKQILARKSINQGIR